MEKRRARRHARRLKVRYGEKGKGFTSTGLTNDVSATGLFVLANTSPRPGTRVHLEVTLPGEVLVFMEAVVARQVVVPPELRQVVKSGFGVRYLLGPEVMAELVPQLREAPKKDDPFTLVFEDVVSWKQAWEKEFSRGGGFVWSPKAVAANSTVMLTFDLRFLGRELAFEARVVHVMPGADGRFGVAMMFTDAGAATAALSATLH
ncbi:MAG: PilZ domain-containing protein [Myxococcales bacterium]|nr:PilZ domain-containing protein [Myxococcales bacterium]